MSNKVILSDDELSFASGGANTDWPDSKYQVGQRIKAKSPYVSYTPEGNPDVEGTIVEISGFYLPSRGHAYLVELLHNGETERVGIYEHDILCVL